MALNCLNTPCRKCISTINKYMNIRTYGSRRKNPINRADEDKLPIFQYAEGHRSDRRIYVCGQAVTGALGIQNNTNKKKDGKFNSLEYQPFPLRLSFAEDCDVTNIAAGYGFTVFSVKNQGVAKVYGTGLNTDSQLGYHAPRVNHPLELLLAPAPIYVPLKTHSAKVIGISAGRAHVAILTNEDGAFTLGNNSFGQCSRKIIPTERYKGSMVVHHIPNINNERIVHVECGQDHSMFLTESGKVYSSGWGTDGQTGLGHFNNEGNLSLVQGDIKDEKIIKLSSKADCVLALSDKGEVFGWGNNEYGQLPRGESDLQQLHTPIYVESTKQAGKVVDVACGGCSCLIVNDEGDIFTWGFGILGKGPVVQQSETPLHIPQTLFGRNDFNPDSRVVQVECGLNFMAAVTNKGELYTWGRNRHGCLGLGNLKDQFFPFKSAVGAEVLKVACGVDHMVVMARPFC